MATVITATPAGLGSVVQLILQLPRQSSLPDVEVGNSASTSCAGTQRPPGGSSSSYVHNESERVRERRKAANDLASAEQHVIQCHSDNGVADLTARRSVRAAPRAKARNLRPCAGRYPQDVRRVMNEDFVGAIHGRVGLARAHSGGSTDGGVGARAAIPVHPVRSAALRAESPSRCRCAEPAP
jgi:hypothetical protein